MNTQDRFIQTVRDTANAILATNEAAVGNDLSSPQRALVDVGIEIGIAAALQAVLDEGGVPQLPPTPPDRRPWRPWRRR